ncbi:MAG: histidine kinase [Desulfobulbaceae bacterium]|nr:histidine kinase [Desulfobulbaceae bacterium]
MRVWDMRLLQDDLPAEKRRSEHLYDYADSEENRRRVNQHFDKLQRGLIIGLIIGFLLPNALLAAYFHYQFTHTLRSSAILNLQTVADNQKNSLDLYLRERIGNLYNLLLSPGFALAPTKAAMNDYLRILTNFHDGFIDVGLINPKGVQIGYAGASPELLGKDYSDTPWLQQLLKEDKHHIVSDSYLGSRQNAEFTMAVRHTFAGKVYVLRATLDPDKLYMLLRSTVHGGSVESALVNANGQYQVVDPKTGNATDRGPFVPPLTQSVAIHEQDIDETSTLIAYTWLKEAPWALLVTQPLSVAQSGMHQARLILTVSLISISLLFCIIIFFTIRKLTNDARRMADKGRQLQEMLAHASKLASIGELAAGVAHEINNPLAIIMATSGVIRDMFNPAFDLDNSTEALYKELTVIDNAATRAKGITKKLQEMGKTRMPQTEPCEINTQVETVVNRLKKVEFKGKAIEVELALSPDLPPILAECERLRQVFNNILVNAADAIQDKGVITITTGIQDGMVAITIADTGRGIPQKNLERIFHPFFTTKGGSLGTGLGLSIAASIVKHLGGVIKVNSVVGKGSTFTILLPTNFYCPLH